MNELYKTINDNNSIISRLNEEKIYLEKELILTKKDIIKKNDELDRLTDECRNLQIKINENRKPTRPTSARSFSSRITSCSSPGSPALANRGSCRVGVAKCLLPQPPRPPLQSTYSSRLDMS